MRIIPIFIFTVLLAFTSTTVLSQTDPPEQKQKRLTGRVEFGVLGIVTTSKISGFDPENFIGESDDISRIDSLDGKQSYNNLFTSFLLFDISYLISETMSIYLGTPFFDDDREGLTTGVQTLFKDNSLLDASLFVGDAELWENPYLIGAERKVTEVRSGGIMIDYDGIMGSGLHMSYTLRYNHVVNDISGDSDPDLKRSGLTHTIKSGYNYYLNDRFDAVLTPSFLYIRDDKDGGAYANNGYGVELSYSLERDKNAFSLAGTVEAFRYDDQHPLFNATRSDTAYTVECYYTRKHLWEKNWYTRIGCGFHKLDSNIGFFDEKDILYGISLGYSFE